MSTGSLLPQQIPPQTVPVGKAGPDGRLLMDVNWYLFFYNLANEVLSQQGAVPASQFDFLDMVDLDAAQTDVPQAYKDIANVGALQNDEISLADVAQLPKRDNNVQLLQQEEVVSADIAGLPRRDANVQSLLIEPDPGISLQQLANIILLAEEPLLQDQNPPPGAVEPITGTSPLNYTAVHDGTFFVSGPPTVTANVVRYGVTVPTGMTDGAIPMRKTDSVQITWSGGTAPVMNFLPNK